ncbi:MAG TPA: hypothetical protein VGK18_02015 [Propionicimonas sp.]|uniref:hypothetical protein n=1 Tax=Propionicimonas sp. TaxID=1955623 RepID=UPI002F402C59
MSERQPVAAGTGRVPSPNMMRARRLLAGGAVGGHAALVSCVVAFGIAGGVPAAVSAALAGVLTIAFFTIGQAVQVLVADADPRTVLFASLVSYIARVGGLGALLAVALANADRFKAMDTTAVAVTTIVVVLCWLAAEIRVFSRLRIPVFDETERPSDTGG